MMVVGRCHLVTGALGLLFGFGLSRIGFSDFGQVHSMFTFSDLRLTLTFATAVFVVLLGYRLWVSPEGYAHHRPHPGTLPGGLLLGAGWALSGACPSIAWVQLGEGRMPALVTLVGIAAGTWLYPRVHARFFGWPTESCSG
ncbi:MAG: YeeE/YedE family protein [Myxococcales bacterium]|nr:YeeE/YedE family protein [Myxococcales bacterium]